MQRSMWENMEHSHEVKSCRETSIPKPFFLSLTVYTPLWTVKIDEHNHITLVCGNELGMNLLDILGTVRFR